MKRHETDVVSMVFGLIFLGIFGLWLATFYDALTLSDLNVLGPVLLVAVGVLGVVVSLSRARKSGREDELSAESDFSQVQ